MSSLIFLGISIVMFFILFGFLSMLTPLILGSFFSLMDGYAISDESWQNIYLENKELAELLVPVTFSMGLVVAIIKILMVAASRGRE